MIKKAQIGKDRGIDSKKGRYMGIPERKERDSNKGKTGKGSDRKGEDRDAPSFKIDPCSYPFSSFQAGKRVGRWTCF